MNAVIEALQASKAVEAQYGDLPYIRLTDGFHHLPRGTVLVDGTLVYGYPSIGRFLTLESGLRNNFHNPFWIEEKIDGYNVRIVKHQDRLLAFTRGGFVCPFTTDRIGDLMPTGIFDDHPDLVICAEVAGPGNPYLESAPPFIDHDVKLFVFDLQTNGQSGFMAHEPMYRLIDEYELPSVHRFGLYEHRDLEKIQSIMLELNEQGREGVVFKENSDRDKRFKYVTANSSIADIRVTAPFLNVPPAEFFIGRILRTAVFSHEQGLKRSTDINQRMGAAFIEGLWQAIEQYRNEHKIYYRHHCRFRHRDNAVALMDFLHRVTRRQHVEIAQHRLEQTEDGYWLLVFDRRYPKMTGLFSQLLAGKPVYD